MVQTLTFPWELPTKQYVSAQEAGDPIGNELDVQPGWIPIGHQACARESVEPPEGPGKAFASQGYRASDHLIINLRMQLKGSQTRPDPKCCDGASKRKRLFPFET